MWDYGKWQWPHRQTTHRLTRAGKRPVPYPILPWVSGPSEEQNFCLTSGWAHGAPGEIRFLGFSMAFFWGDGGWSWLKHWAFSWTPLVNSASFSHRSPGCRNNPEPRYTEKSGSGGGVFFESLLDFGYDRMFWCDPVWLGLQLTHCSLLAVEKLPDERSTSQKKEESFFLAPEMSLPIWANSLSTAIHSHILR